MRLIQGSFITKSNYDKNGYLDEVEDELGYKTTSLYDEVGNKKEETDAKGNKKTYFYYPTNLLENLHLPNGSKVHYDYDKNGNMALKSITDKYGKSQKFQYEYDAMDRLFKTTGPLNDVTIYDYDADGNNQVVREYTYHNGQQLTMTSNGQVVRGDRHHDPIGFMEILKNSQ